MEHLAADIEDRKPKVLYEPVGLCVMKERTKRQLHRCHSSIPTIQRGPLESKWMAHETTKRVSLLSDALARRYLGFIFRGASEAESRSTP
jgi:hypothetical protein